MRTVIALLSSFLFASIAFAANLDYIVGLSDPVTKDKFTTAKADIEKAGGTVLHEITLGMNGIVVSLPSDQAESFKSKSYVDFIEEDQAVHASF